MTSLRASRTLLVLVAMLLVAFAPAQRAAAAEAPARHASGWIARNLAANGYLLPSSSDAWGLTIDALLLMAATDTGGDVARGVVDRLASEGEAQYVAQSAGGDQGRRAKLAYALLVGGRDASSLASELRASLQPDGRFGTTTNTFGQAYGVLALARTPEGVPPAALDRLRAVQCTTSSHAQRGGFGFGGCATVDGDATAMAVLALRVAGVPASDPVLVEAAAWMQRRQLADGSFAAQASPSSGNANSTGLVAHAARELGTAPMLEVAAAAATYLRTLQVTCASPLIAGDDPSVGGGFPRSWIGAIAYDAELQDDAVANGIPPAQYTTWWYSTLQAALGLDGVRSLGSVSSAGIPASTEPAPTCDTAPVAPVVDSGPGAPPATTFRVRTATRPIAIGARFPVRIEGLQGGEQYVVVLSGRVLARGTTPASGTVVRTLVLPRSLGTAPGRVLRVTGATLARTGTARVATAAPRRLALSPRSSAVLLRARVRLVVGLLLPREAFSIRVAGRVVARGFADSRGRAVATLYVTQRGRLAVTACGVTCSRVDRGVIVVR